MNISSVIARRTLPKQSPHKWQETTTFHSPCQYLVNWWSVQCVSDQDKNCSFNPRFRWINSFKIPPKNLPTLTRTAKTFKTCNRSGFFLPALHFPRIVSRCIVQTIPPKPKNKVFRPRLRNVPKGCSGKNVTLLRPFGTICTNIYRSCDARFVLTRDAQPAILRACPSVPGSPITTPAFPPTSNTLRCRSSTSWMKPPICVQSEPA